VRGYLIDANHVSAYHRQESTFMARLRKVTPDTLIRVCAVTLGEIEAGLLMTDTTNQQRRDEYLSFVIEELLPYCLDITQTTRFTYAEIMARLFRANPPAKSDLRTDVHLASLGVDINDVWICAVAWEHGLTLLTQDKMKQIRSVVPEINVESWI